MNSQPVMMLIILEGIGLGFLPLGISGVCPRGKCLGEICPGGFVLEILYSPHVTKNLLQQFVSMESMACNSKQRILRSDLMVGLKADLHFRLTIKMSNCT